MTLATYSDANAYLDGTKIAFLNDVQAQPEADRADAVVKARLVGVYPDYVDTWVAENPTPPDELTPNLVRQIAGMLMASYYYAKLYSEETVEASTYASRLERSATQMLDDIVEGTLQFDDKSYVAASEIAQDDYWPNDTTLDDNSDPVRAFDMETKY